ncbi:MAG: nucleotide exchange factor GrpE [Clostridia bacterium]|nr:nucleotide exchange factor GrpE [Clostridia bacterium]
MENEKMNNTEEATEEVKASECDKKEEKCKKKEEKACKKSEKEIESLKSQLAESNDKYLRLAAEYDNYRKRTAKEKSDAYAEAYSDAVKAILPLADSLDKALEFSPDDDGIKALSKLLTDTFAKIGVAAIESDGKEFDPNLHNAIMHEDDESLGENLVVQTFQKGYTLGEKVIRHAMVKVVN